MNYTGAAVKITVAVSPNASIVVRGFATAHVGQYVSVTTLPTECGKDFGRIKVPAHCVAGDNGKD